MRFGFTYGDEQALLRKGCAKVFKNELDAIHALREGDELLTTDVTALFESLAEDHGDVYKILKAEDVPSGLTFEEDATVEHMHERGYDQNEIAKRLHLSKSAVSSATIYNADKIQKAYLQPSVKKQSTGNVYDDARAELAKATAALVAKMTVAKSGRDEAAEAEEELERKAQELRNRNPRMTREQALAKTYTENPDLIAKMR
ncbi:hypothetical protein SAMN05880582_101661 [Rhizobium sp. RU20A]|uniref:helix-turn-helix domain-containing protein n=1 Tax=Rhizobium sp. RU20A TaxID=1907412 RepID=UPI000955EBB7|nr:helix-turn-helix domain-containing protein [Rhizobium sp. RU20A]SIQ08339.1 hypothetical protein SAMN05880582_101661 [Rhizobium sp. RU20A]